MLIRILSELKDAGHDPNASLDQSMFKGWTSVYEPKDRVIQKKGGEAQQEWTQDRTAMQVTPEQREAISLMLKTTASRLRSVR